MNKSPDPDPLTETTRQRTFRDYRRVVTGTVWFPASSGLVAVVVGAAGTDLTWGHGSGDAVAVGILVALIGLLVLFVTPVLWLLARTPGKQLIEAREALNELQKKPLVAISIKVGTVSFPAHKDVAVHSRSFTFRALVTNREIDRRVSLEFRLLVTPPNHPGAVLRVAAIEPPTEPPYAVEPMTSETYTLSAEVPESIIEMLPNLETLQPGYQPPWAFMRLLFNDLVSSFQDEMALPGTYP